MFEHPFQDQVAAIKNHPMQPWVDAYLAAKASKLAITLPNPDICRPYKIYGQISSPGDTINVSLEMPSWKYNNLAQSAILITQWILGQDVNLGKPIELVMNRVLANTLTPLGESRHGELSAITSPAILDSEWGGRDPVTRDEYRYNDALRKVYEGCSSDILIGVYGAGGFHPLLTIDWTISNTVERLRINSRTATAHFILPMKYILAQFSINYISVLKSLPKKENPEEYLAAVMQDVGFGILNYMSLFLSSKVLQTLQRGQKLQAYAPSPEEAFLNTLKSTSPRLYDYFIANCAALLNKLSKANDH